MTTMLMKAWMPMKMSARFHASVSEDCAPKNTTTAHITLQGAASVGTLQKSTNGKSYIMRETVSSGQMPVEESDYWFMSDDTSADELGEIVTADAAVDLRFDQLSEAFEPAIELATSERHSRVTEKKINSTLKLD